MPFNKEKTFKLSWCKKENEFVYKSSNKDVGEEMRESIHHFPTFILKAKEYGYDPKTLIFTVKKGQISKTSSAQFDEDTTLKVRWNKRANDWLIYYPERTTGWLCYSFLRGDDLFPSFIDELKIRGYNILTFSLTIKVKKQIKKERL